MVSSVLIGAAKVLAVGGLMAGAAGGIYFVSSTDDPDGKPRAAAETASPGQSPAITNPTPTSESVESNAYPPHPDQAMLIGGTVWVNARIKVGTVEALIAGKVCARTDSRPAPDAPPSFAMYIPAVIDEPGCGAPGALVEFRIDGTTLDQRVPFQRGIAHPVTLTSGPPFMRINGRFYVSHSAETVQLLVQAYVGDAYCGEDLNGGVFGGTTRGYQVVVHSAEQTARCGAPGALVELRLTRVEDDGTRVPLGITIGTLPWEPGATVDSEPVHIADVPLE